MQVSLPCSEWRYVTYRFGRIAWRATTEKIALGDRRIKMNAEPTYDGLDPFEDPVDRLLAQIALELQLPQTLHDQVGGRYEAVRRKLESTPEFENAIEPFYP